MTRYQTLAAEKWPRAVIEGDGGFALLVQREGNDITRAVLFRTQTDAERSRPFYNASVIQTVEPCYVPNRCSKVHDNDADDRRREREERRQER